MAAGTVSVLHVGGYQPVAASPDREVEAAVPTWEFFISDRPHAPLVDAAGRRQPFVQMADADRQVHSGAGPHSGLRSPEVRTHAISVIATCIWQRMNGWSRSVWRPAWR